LVRPPVHPSVLRFAVLFSPSPWAPALLGERGAKIKDFVPEMADPATMERVREALTIGLILAFPVSAPTGQPTYAFEHTLHPAATAWADGIAEGDAAGALRALVECHHVVSDREKLG